MRTSIFGRLLQRKVKSEMIIHFGRENYAVKRDTEATGRELHMLFRLPPNDDLFRVVGTKAIGNPIKDYEIVQLHEHDDFTAAPPHISGGAIGFPLAYTANREGE